MAAQKVDGTKLKQALQQFGSLQETVEHLENEKSALEKRNEQLGKDNQELAMTQEKLSQN